MKPCAFSQGSTTNEGKKQAPDQCRKAILEVYKRKVEQCDLAGNECPMRCYIPYENKGEADHAQV